MIERRVNGTILQTVLPPVPPHVVSMLHRFAAAKPLPKSFDWREKTTLCPVTNQQQCGACWCFSATSAFSDRLRISGVSNVTLNQIPTLSCIAKEDVSPDGPCGGGFPENCFDFFEEKGASEVSSTCISWDDLCSQQNSEIPELPDCSSLTCDMKYFAAKGSKHSLYVLNYQGEVDEASTILAIKTSLLDGPVVGKFSVWVDFMAPDWSLTNEIYINGAYDSVPFSVQECPEGQLTCLDPDTYKQQSCTVTKPSKCLDGGHAVEIVGWGSGDAGGEYGVVDYWIIKNSWGDAWQDKGYFKFAMTNKSKGINTNCGLDVPIQLGPNDFNGGTVICNVGGTGSSETPGDSSVKSSDNSKMIWWTCNFITFVVSSKTGCLIFLILLIK
jgi:hypothetical protein